MIIPANCYVSSGDSDQFGHPFSLIRVFDVSSVDDYYPKRLSFCVHANSDY